MKRLMFRGVMIGAAVLWPTLASTVLAQTPNADSLMAVSHQAYFYAADGGQARVTMVLTDKKGRTRTREFWMLRRDIEDMGDQRYYTYFIKPADIRRTAFLVHKKAQGNDDRWLYLPALDLVKRIAADDRQSSFVGSDFTYEDVSGRLPILDNHAWIGPDTVNGRAAIKIKATPKESKTAKYQYRTVWIDVETNLPLREDFFDKKDTVVRRFEVGKIEIIDNIPTATVRTMTNLKRKHSTTITFTEVSFENPLDAKKFNERLLKNPPSALRK